MSFLICFSFVALVTSVPVTPSFAPLLSFLAPWLALALFLLNLPFFAAARRAFRLSPAERRNHALEHATIFYLRERYGRSARLAGRAAPDGFRISGVREPSHVRTAFDRAAESLEAGDWSCTVAKRCGSMVVTAQALGITLLAIAFLASYLLPLAVSRLLTALSGVVFLLLRLPLGLWLQRRRFLLWDFHLPAILAIDPVEPRPILDRPRSFFVRTRLSLR